VRETHPCIFLYSRHYHFGTFHSLWRAFVCLRHRPPPPVHLTTAWRHPSLLHRFWSVSPKNSFNVGNKWKSLGAKSEQYAGCSKTSQPNSWSIACVLPAACGHANGLYFLGDSYVYTGADKSLARPGRKQATFPAFDGTCRFITTFTRVHHLSLPQPNQSISLPITLLTSTTCFVPHRAKDLSAPRYSWSCVH